jgi:hypothetical protein
MGRQTIWGGAGKPPSREVMQAAAKAARQEMMERIRTNKAAQGQGERGPRQGNGGGGRSETAAAHAAKARTQVEAALARVVAQVAATLNRHLHAAGPRPDNSARYDDAQPPRANAHLGTHLGHSNPAIAMEATARAANPTPCAPAWTAWPNAVAAAVAATVAAEAATVVAVVAAAEARTTWLWRPSRFIQSLTTPPDQRAQLPFLCGSWAQLHWKRLSHQCIRAAFAPQSNGAIQTMKLITEWRTTR